MNSYRSDRVLVTDRVLVPLPYSCNFITRYFIFYRTVITQIKNAGKVGI